MLKNVQSQYLKNIATIMSGTIGMQMILFMSLPIITGIFSPENYGLYSESLSYALILSAVLVLGLDRAIPLSSKNDIDSNSFFLLLLSLFFSLLIFVLLFFLFENREKYIYILVLSLGFCLFNILNFRLISENDYKFDAMVRCYQVALLSIMQIISGFFFPNYVSLSLSDFFSKVLVLIYSVPKSFKFIFKNSLTFFLGKKEFYTYGLMSTILTSISMNIPIILIGYYYGSKYVGLFFLAQKLTTAPVTLLGTSISKAYYIKMNEIKYSNGDIMAFFLYNLKKTCILAMLLVPALYIFSLFFPLFFNEEWGDASIFLLLLIPLVFGQMIYNPISMTITVLNKQKYDLIFSLLRVVGVFILFKMSSHFEVSIFKTILNYSLWMMTLYISMTLVSYWCVSTKFVMKTD
ncbi:lipopolysaccharide biosynthesis protein [Mesoflavibacter zeaxanthinifaciens]|uniref:lipopolysaccharide biosynthesis protein n=1 Tax=Mesoflavibacter zeaxanthinifaciens TaxID=393060 RepID=UPI003A8E2BEE